MGCSWDGLRGSLSDFKVVGEKGGVCGGEVGVEEAGCAWEGSGGGVGCICEVSE